MKRPNVVFLFADDQRFSTVCALGNGAVKTPNIDKLAGRGAAFTHAHIPGGTSGAVCMPSRAMLHSGRTLFHIDGAGESIPEDHTTLGEAMRAAGYRTFGTGKWHNGREAFHRSFTDGDEIFFGGMADHWNVPVYRYDPTGKYEAVCLKTPHAFTSNETMVMQCDHVHAGVHSTDLITGASAKFIDGYNDDAPFFMYVSFLAPHDPRTMPPEFLDMYDPENIELPPNFMSEHPFDNGVLQIRDEKLAGFPRTETETRRHIAEYYAMISHLDHRVGRIVQALEDKGELENTIIVFAGDNGLAVGQHGLFGKQNCYDHSVRVPLIFAGPGVPAGRKTDAFAYLLDIFPTLCELTGTDVPASVEGKSLVNAMGDPAGTVRETLYFAYTDKHRAVRDRRFKLIEYVVNGSHNMTQLFDLENDPWEMHNLAPDPAHAGKLAELRTELQKYSREWNDRESQWGRTFWPVYDQSYKGSSGNK